MGPWLGKWHPLRVRIDIAMKTLSHAPGITQHQELHTNPPTFKILPELFSQAFGYRNQELQLPVAGQAKYDLALFDMCENDPEQETFPDGSHGGIEISRGGACGPTGKILSAFA